MIKFIFFLSILLSILVLSQTDKSDNLSGAFNGDFIFQTQAEKTLKKTTFIIYGIIVITLLINMFILFKK